MTHLYRFHVPPETGRDATLALPAQEAHHALHVVRVRAGDPVVLFDGRGRELHGTVCRTTRHEVYVAIEDERRCPQPRTALTLLQARPNRDKSLETIVRRGTELGVTRFCVYRADHGARPSCLSPKWLRVAIEACKQCGRAWLPEFDVAPDLRAALEGAPETRLIATNHRDPVPLKEALAAAPRAVAVVVGPEGDFSAAELEWAHDLNGVPISLGGATYRTEVAATLAVALVQYELGELGPR